MTRTVEGGATIIQATGGEPRDTLNRERVVRAAMDLADESGIESVTMRELGRRLGVEAASLYNHVAGKDDLLDGMVDLVVAEIDLPSGDVGWQDAMRRRAVSAREVFERHRWAAGLIDSRGRSGPSSLAYADRVLCTLLRAGFSPRLAASAFLALDSYIYGFERQRSNIAPLEDEDAAEVAQEVLAAIPEGAYPSLARVAMQYAEEPYDDDAAFDFGLNLILDGLERLLG
jgi:AcrR family transcriptional regulator